MSKPKWPKCYGCNEKRVPSLEFRFCSNVCARSWAEAMAEGYTWCEAHQSWEDTMGACGGSARHEPPAP